jgi:hypothetical protein
MRKMGTKMDFGGGNAMLDLANTASYFTDYILGFQ